MKNATELANNKSHSKAQICANLFWNHIMTTFPAFRRRYLDEAVQFMAPNTQTKIAGLFDLLEQRGLRLLSDMDSQWISRWAAWRRNYGRCVRDTTIHGNLLYIQAMLRWAFQQRLIPEVPHIKFPPRAKHQKLMKGRPVTSDEFQRILSKCPDGAVRFFVEFIWWSGLRIDETFNLSWDSCPDCLVVDFSQVYPMFLVPASGEKGNTERLLPMAPEASGMLSGVPHADRTGKVFKLPFRSSQEASGAISAIGKAAGVIVKQSPIKYASAHDLRRSFGERWALRVMPQVLMELMRHQSIETTMKYYVGINAQRTAKTIWDAMPKNSIDNQAAAS